MTFSFHFLPLPKEGIRQQLHPFPRSAIALCYGYPRPYLQREKFPIDAESYRLYALGTLLESGDNAAQQGKHKV